MLTLLTIALIVLRIALTLIINSLRITIAGLRKGAKLAGKTTQGIVSGSKKKKGVKVAQKTLEIGLKTLEWVLRLVDALITIFLTSLIGLMILVVLLLLVFIVSAILPLLFFTEDNQVLDSISGETSGVSSSSGRTVSRTSDGDWDFEVVPFEQVTNIAEWVKTNPEYMNGLTEESKYVIRVLNGKFPQYKLISLVRPGDRLSHGKGKGIDLAIEGEEGWVVANWLSKNSKKLKISEIIYQTKYWVFTDPEAGFKSGILPIKGNKTQDHYDHIHISVNYLASQEGDVY